MWLGSGAVVLAGAAAIPLGRWLAQSTPAYRAGKFGTLRPDPNGILDLLEGFEYRIVQRSGERMSDGHAVPRRPDGMACFEGSEPGTIVLVRNHEIPSGVAMALFGGHPRLREAYDPGAGGGVTRVVLDARTFEARSSNYVLAGTVMNCAGGASPWGWLSCEETVERDHGFVFLCDPSADRVRRPARIDGYGRFRHEAVTVDRERMFAYLTEDQSTGCLYRFRPDDPSEPFEGRLQALRVRGRDAEDTAPLRAGARREIEWIDLTNVTSDTDDLRVRARAAGAASFKRGEGIVHHGGAVYACMSTGGPLEGGQIFRLVDDGDGGTLEVFAASSDRRAIDMPDNVCFAPSGTLYFVEDGPESDFVRGVTSDGEPFDLARNAASDGEIAGVCASPDGRALFVNLQEDGITVAITGPFDRLVA